MSGSPYLDVADVAERLHCSVRTVHSMASAREIPHRRLPGRRRLLFLEDELARWEAGAALDVRELDRDGRVVAPR